MGDYQVDRARWAELAILEQMGNIGSEVGMAIAAHRNGKTERGIVILAAFMEK